MEPGDGSRPYSGCAMDASRLTRRSLVVGAAVASAGAATAPWAWSARRRRPVLHVRDFRGGRSDVEALRTAFAAARRRRATVALDASTYMLHDDVVVTWSGLHLEGEGESSRIVQMTPGRGFLQLRRGGHRVSGFAFACGYTRTAVEGTHRGYLGFHRVGAVWLEGGDSRIEHVHGDNAFVTVCLRGPVVRTAETGPGRARGFDFSALATDNVVRDISGTGSDFVLTGNQQQRLLIDGLRSAGTTSLSVPPHAIYMQNPASDEASCGASIDVVARRLSAVGNPYAEAFKFSDVRGLRVDRVTADRCAGGVLVSSSENVVVSRGRFTRLASVEPGVFAALDVSQSRRTTIRDCVVDAGDGVPCSGVLVRHGSRRVDAVAVMVLDDLPEGVPAAPFRVEDDSEALFRGCARIRKGADRPAFVLTERAYARIVRPKMQGSGLLLRATSRTRARIDLEGSVRAQLDPQRGIQSEGFVSDRLNVRRSKPPRLPSPREC